MIKIVYKIKVDFELILINSFNSETKKFVYYIRVVLKNYFLCNHEFFDDGNDELILFLDFFIGVIKAMKK